MPSMPSPAHPPVPQAPCFHCGLPVPHGLNLAVEFDGQSRPVCCRGCEAVARAIIDGGLGQYYRFRTEASGTVREVVPQLLRQLAVYDHPDIQKSFVRRDGEHVREASLILEGIVCAACAWLNEQHIASLPGVLEVSVNYATHRARVRWDDTRIHLSDILEAVTRIGYLAHPYDPGRQQELLEKERNSQLRRLGIAGALAMQVMILAVAMYAGDWWGMEPQFRTFFRWVSLVLTVPVFLYSAAPFFRAAWRDLRRARAGMDVPVSLGIAAAFAASLWDTVQGQGHVYYDSVVMFVFFLLASRYFELVARKRAAEATESLAQGMPSLATRLCPRAGAEGFDEERVPAAELREGDRVAVLPGDVVPADGVVVAGRSTVDESLLTGEPLPALKPVGAPVVAGTINVESPLQVEVQKAGPDTVLATLLRLLDRAQSEKPAIARLADRIASRFVLGVLLLAAAVALYWWHADPAHWLATTIAVLVVTCPCALSLATPTAIAAATGNLTRHGLLATRGHALESLARATDFVFDKTGTLTEGRPRLIETRMLSAMDAQAALRVAAALERHSEHPLARALTGAWGGAPLPEATAVDNSPGDGLHGTVAGTEYWVGTPGFVVAATGRQAPETVMAPLRREGYTLVLLATRETPVAVFALRDALRPGARELVQGLRRAGKNVWLLTGDHEAAAQHVAAQVGIDRLAWGLKPRDKLQHVQALQQRGAVVAMVGDGINDAPVLGQAQVSIAMGSGTHLAAASADMVLLTGQLPVIGLGVRIAAKSLAVIRENLAWAVVYNLVAVPLAALGYVAPWVAALGMSGSSLVVVANALRLTRRPRKAPGGEEPNPTLAAAGAGTALR